MSEQNQIDLSQRLHYSHVRDVFLQITDEIISSKVVVKPPGNSVCIYKGDIAGNCSNGSTTTGRKKLKNTMGDWKSDCYQWAPLGTEAVPKANPLFVRRAFAARTAHYKGKNVASSKQFRRDAFHVHTDCTDDELLAYKEFCVIHYYGDPKVL